MTPGPIVHRNTLRKRQRCMSKRATLWAAMRMLRHFTIGDLLAVCDLDARKRMSVTSYCGQLRRAGFLRMAEPNRGQHQAGFVLARNSGPQPPAFITRKYAMYDANTEQTYPLKRTSHAGK
jgi:hypothetical protein